MLIGIESIGYLPIGVDGATLTISYTESNTGVLTLSATGPHTYSPIYQNWTAVEDNYNFSIDWVASETVLYNISGVIGLLEINSTDVHSSTLTSTETTSLLLNATQSHNVSLAYSLDGELILNSTQTMFPVVGEISIGSLTINASTYVAPYLALLQSTVDEQNISLTLSGSTDITLVFNTGIGTGEIPQIWIG